MSEPAIANNSKHASRHRRRAFLWVLYFAAILIAGLLIYTQLLHTQREHLFSQAKEMSKKNTFAKTSGKNAPQNGALPNGWIIRSGGWKTRVDFDGSLILATHEERPSWDQAINLLRGYKAAQIHCDNLAGVEQLGSFPIELTLIPSKFNPEDLEYLQALKNMSTLELYETGISDIAALSGLNNLKSLNLGQTQVSNISALRTMKHLKSLSLFRTQVTDITPLEGLSELAELDLSSTEVSDIAPVKKMFNLTKLDLSCTPVADISVVSELRRLEDLKLFETSVADITPLVRLERLRSLDLRETKVADASPLAGIKSLEYLDLQGMIKIQGISVLRGLKHLTLIEPDAPPY